MSLWPIIKVMFEGLRIRPYRAEDRESLLKIAADTAFFGEPVEKFIEDRRIFLDAFYLYYTDYEPQHSWVAVCNEQVVGFLTGCYDTRLQREYTGKVLEKRALKKVLTGKYRLGKKFLRYLFRYWMSKMIFEKTAVDLTQYPAHFHINVESKWRGQGIGRNLIETYLKHLEKDGICGVHLQTTSFNKVAVGLYEKMGFKLLSSVPSYLWQSLVNEPIYELTYGKILLLR